MKNAFLSLSLMLLSVAACILKAERTDTDTPQFHVIAGDIISISVESAVVHIEFSASKAEAFRKFTRENVGRNIQVVAGTKVIAEPLVRSEIPNGKIDASFLSAEDAQVFATRLSQKESWPR
jgi:preprotein translocase subunit SecD